MSKMARSAIDVEYDVNLLREKIYEETGFYFEDTDIEDEHGHDLMTKAQFANEEDYKIILNDIKMILESDYEVTKWVKILMIGLR